MSSDDAARVSNAVSMLVRGGTLTSEPCSKCGGVQVRFADKTTCINCGEQHSVVAAAEPAEDRNTEISETDESGPASAAQVLKDKIAGLVAGLREENDISSQKQKAELIEIYLRILEKVKSLGI